MEFVAPLVEDMDPLKYSLSKKKTRVFNWVDDNGESMTRRRPYTEAWYEKKDNKACFVLNNVKTYKGIQISKKFKKPTGFMVLSLSDEQANLVKEKVDKVLFNLIFVNRKELLKDGKDIEDPREIIRMYKGVVKKGEEKQNEPGKFWQDSVIAGVTLRQEGPNTVPDENVCPIEDLEGKPYAWTGLQGKTLEEVGVEIERIDLEPTEFKVKLNICFITSKEKSRAKVTSRRRMQQTKKSGKEESSGADADPDATDAVTSVGSKRKAENQEPGAAASSSAATTTAVAAAAATSEGPKDSKKPKSK